MLRLLAAIWFVLLLIVLTVLALPILLAVEVWCRCVYRRPWFIAERWYQKYFRRSDTANPFDYPLNKWGLRDRDYPQTGEKGVARILVLGDSFTEGSGLHEAQHTFPKVLENLLNEKFAPLRVEVLNAGLGGSLTNAWVNTLRHVGPEFRPDLVLVVYFLRDGTYIGSIPNFFRAIRDSFLRTAGLLYRVSYFYRRSADARLLSRLSAQYLDEFYRSYFGNDSETIEWRVAQDNLVHLKNLAAGLGAEFAVVNFPMLFRLDSNHPFLPIYERLRSFAQANGISYLDLFPAFKDRDAESLWVSRIDQHPNRAGHGIAAHYLAASIELGPQ